MSSDRIDPRMVAWQNVEPSDKIDPRMVRWSAESPSLGLADRVGNLWEGAKLGLKAPVIGAGNMVGLVSDEKKNAYRAELEANASKPGGAGGQILGTGATTAPALFVPGGNTLAAQAGIGAVYGLAQPADSWKERGINTVTGGTGGVAGQLAGRALGAAGSKFLTAAEQRAAAEASRNSIRDATLAEAQAAGYVVPPSMAGAGLGSRLLEGLSGKYKTNQLAGIKNQDVTNALLRKSVGLPDDAPLTSEAMQAIRKQAYQTGYEPVANAGTIKADATYQSDLDKLIANHQGAARSFPGAVADDVTKSIEPFKVGGFDAGDGIKAVQILRDEASAAFRAGNTGLAQAKKGAAKAIEDQIERGLAAKGEDGAALLKDFREARVKMAKAHTAEEAIREGGGVADAKVLGRRLQQGKPLTEEQATIGRFANNFSDVAGIPKSGNANPFTVVDAGVGGAGAGMANPLLAALPLGRVAARQLLLNPLYQRTFVNPGSYGPGVLPRIPGAVAPLLGPAGGPAAVGLLNSN